MSKTSQELIVWQDISKQLIGLVKQVLQSNPAELDETAIETLVQPYLKQIEQDVENRLRQAREDEQARVKTIETKNWEDKVYSNLQDNLQHISTLKIGEHKGTCKYYETKWIDLLPRIGEILPEFADVKVTRTPALFAEFPRVKKFTKYLYNDGTHEDLEHYRQTITIEGVPLNCQKALIKCHSWDGVVAAISANGIPMSLETKVQLMKLPKARNDLGEALCSLNALLSKRQVRSSDVIRFFMNSKIGLYKYVTCGVLADELETTSARNIAGQHHVDLLPPQRRPIPKTE